MVQWFHNFFKLPCNVLATSSMNPIVVSYFLLSLWMSKAKSLVIIPFSIVATTAFSNSLAKSVKSSFLSNLALFFKPLDQAKILATEFVEVGFPF